MSTYSQLKQIIPADQALSNKALQAAFEQIKTIFDSSLPLVARATAGLESNVGLNLINDLTEPLPANVVTYFTTTFSTGTGEDGVYLLTDFIGTPTGWVHNEALANTISILNAMTSAGAFSTLTDPTTGVYTVMATTISGAYTTQTAFDPPDPADEWTTTIPGGLPGAGSYVGGSASASIQAAFTGGLTPAMVSAVATIVSNNSANVAQTTTNFNNMSSQIILENNNLALAGVVLADLVVGQRPFSLVTGLPSSGRDTTEGGAAYVMQSLANQSSIGGQAVISTMREARNQDRLATAGITTDIIVSDELAEPQADLGISQYTVAQATSQKII
jgi:hypothetical protein